MKLIFNHAGQDLPECVKKFIASIISIPFLDPQKDAVFGQNIIKHETLDYHFYSYFKGDVLNSLSIRTFDVQGAELDKAIHESVDNRLIEAAIASEIRKQLPHFKEETKSDTYPKTPQAVRAMLHCAYLIALIIYCENEHLAIDQKYIDQAYSRWGVWRQGYILVGDINGYLHVCRKFV